MGYKEWNFLLDFDGTCVDTQKPFDFWHEIICGFLAGKLGVTSGEAKKIHNKMWMQGIKKYNVHRPSLIEHYQSELINRYENELGWGDIEYLIGLMHMVYSTPVEAFGDAWEFVQSAAAITTIGLCTHADREWTIFKMNTSKMSQYIPQNRVHCTETLEPKDDRAWREAADKLGFTPSNTVVVGDSITSDMLPAIQVGFGKVFYLKRLANKTNLTSGNGAELPKGVIEISSMMQVLNYLS